MAVCGVKVGKICYFESILGFLDYTKVFGCINYKKNAEEMALFQKYEVYC